MIHAVVKTILCNKHDFIKETGVIRSPVSFVVYRFNYRHFTRYAVKFFLDHYFNVQLFPLL